MRWFHQKRFLCIEGGLFGDCRVGMENSEPDRSWYADRRKVALSLKSTIRMLLVSKGYLLMFLYPIMVFRLFQNFEPARYSNWRPVTPIAIIYWIDWKSSSSSSITCCSSEVLLYLKVYVSYLTCCLSYERTVILQIFILYFFHFLYYQKIVSYYSSNFYPIFFPFPLLSTNRINKLAPNTFLIQCFQDAPC